MREVVLIATLCLLASTGAAFACGTERWAVKVGTDRGAASVAINPEVTTIAELAELEPPNDPNNRPSS